MAAPSLTPKQQKSTVRSKSNKKKECYKSVLNTPYNVTWPVVDSRTRNLIEPQIQQAFSEIDYTYCSIPQNLTGRRNEVKRKLYIEEKEKEEEYKKKKRFREQLTFGLNMTSRALEQGKLRGVLMSRDINSKLAMMSKNIAMMCSVRSCPALCLPDMGQLLEPLLKIDCISAIGIKKIENVNSDENSPIERLADIITNSALPINVPWLPEDTDKKPGQESEKLQDDKSDGADKELETNIQNQETQQNDIVDNVNGTQGKYITQVEQRRSQNDTSESKIQDIPTESNPCQKDTVQNVSYPSPYILKSNCLCHRKITENFISLKSNNQENSSDDEIVYTASGVQRKRKHCESKGTDIGKGEFVDVQISKIEVSKKDKKKRKKKLKAK